MVLVVIAILLSIAVMVLGTVLFIKNKTGIGIATATVGLVMLIMGSSITIVPTGYTGVRTTFGQISNKTVKNGINWHIPFAESIHKINCKQQEKDFENLQVWGETSERTELYFEKIIIDYQINSEYAAWIWQNVEEWDTKLLKQTSVESGIKTAAKKYTDIDVTDRSKIEVAAKEQIQKNLDEKYGLQILNIVKVTIGNINFSDAYNAESEKKAKAKLESEAAEYAAQKRLVEERAEAETKRIKAQAEADAITIKAEAEAEANRKLSESLTPELIENKKIDKWDGKLPTVSGEASPIIGIDLWNETE